MSTQMLHSLLKERTSRAILIAALVVLSFGYALTSNAQQQHGEVPSLIYKIIMKNGLGAGGINGGFSRISFADPDAMHSVYESLEYQPVWLGRGSSTERAEEALALFEDAWRHGLNPDHYHVKQIRSLLNNPISVDKARLELFLSDAAMRYGRDLTGMRVDPGAIKQRGEYWRVPFSGEEVMAHVTRARNPVSALESLAPNTKLYRALQDELVRLINEEGRYEHLLPMNFGGDHHFTPGERHKDVEALRVRIGYDRADGPYYDDDTAGAVMAFQRQHGLEPDGIIGPQTLSVLNRSQSDRKHQVIANMERLRWLDQERPDRYLLVNIPQQLLWGVENGRVDFEMKVIVGLPYRRTKDFTTEATGVRFNPRWHVPLSIKMRDFLPKLQEDPAVLAEKKISLIRGYGHEAEYLDPYSIDWHNISWGEMGKIRFVQSAGDHNALGRVRVLMPNRYNIYMHDTNKPEYFERGQRTLSSGCVRMSEPEKAAEFILRHNDGWSKRDMDELIAAGDTVEVYADEPFPVYIIYQSIWLDDKGRLVYGPDLYRRDRDLIAALDNINGYKLPDATDRRYAEPTRVTGDQTTLAYNE